MCGRYTLTLDLNDLNKYLSDHFKVELRNNLIKLPNYNVSPGTDVLSVIHDGEGYRVGLLDWGFRGFDKSDFKVINIRQETMYTKPMFKRHALSKRCIVLADSYYEWLDKVPYRVLRQDKKIFAIAGIWNIAKDEKGKTHKTVGLVTKDAVGIFQEVHPRMPLILEDNEIMEWLKPSNQAFASNLKLNEYEIYEVSTKVNYVKNNDPSLIKRV